MTRNAIYINNLIKQYEAVKGKNYLALDSLSLNVPQGSIFGLLGPNGAGKSTLINILAGTVVKNSGDVQIMGSSIDEEPKKAKQLIGIVPQEVSYDTFFPLYQGLEFYAGYYGIRPKNRRTEEILKALGLWSKRNNKPQQLSGGMKRRYLIAKAMVHSPKVLILDEPTAGVDLDLRLQLWEYVRKINREGVTIIITTHYLAEAEEMCDEIAFIDKGKIIKQDSKKNLLNALESRYMDIEFKDNILVSSLKGACGKMMQQLEPNKIRLHIDSEENTYSKIIKKLSEVDADVMDIKVSQVDLEEVFRHFIKS